VQAVDSADGDVLVKLTKGEGSVRHLVAGTHTWGEYIASWPRNGPGVVWFDGYKDGYLNPTRIHIVDGDLINDSNKVQRIADADKVYRDLKDKSVGRMKPVGGRARPQRDAKRKANIGLKSYNAWCKNPGSRHSRVGQQYTCPGFDTWKGTFTTDTLTDRCI
jgi:hypothetical protein